MKPGRAVGFALIALLLLAFSFSPQSAHSSAQSGVSDARFARLRRGINTSHWFAQVFGPDGYTRKHFDLHTTAEDIALIKAMGFDHIRLSVEPAPLLDIKNPDKLAVEYLGYLDRAIDLILERGLAVIIDIHPSDEFKKGLNRDDGVEAFSQFWRALALHLSARDPERVFLEILNEPVITDGYRWLGIQAKMIAAIRASAPHHTIIATAHRWSSPDEFLFLEPAADSNVIYNFHFYEPHTFTHQGATWGAKTWPYIKNIPYPSTPQSVSEALSSIIDGPARLELARYGQERWDAGRIESIIAKVADWAARRKVRVTCNEFGVYRRHTPLQARAAWIRDVRLALERHSIGWTMWDYAGSFGVVNKRDGRAVADSETVKALGLRAP
jgi:aryl-phospho-beta-D-glucosidase BglC (GH1 family)